MPATDRTDPLAERLSAIEDRLTALEAREADDEEALGSIVARLLPSEALGHVRAARKSDLLAVRVIIDRWISRLERAPGERSRRRESIHLD